MLEPTTPLAADSTPDCRTVNNKILYVAGGISLAILIAAVVLAYGESPETKKSFFSSATWSIGVIIGSALVAMGYSAGKLFEGVVPKGWQSIFKSIAAAPTAEIKSERTTVNTPVANIATDQTTMEDDAMKKKLPVFLPFIVSLLFFSSGCVGTSAAFKTAAKAGVDNVVMDMREYANTADYDTNHDGAVDASEATVKAQEVALTDQLAASVADPKSITPDAVDLAWQPVKPVWTKHVQANPILKAPEDQKTVLDTGVLLDSIIAKERERQRSLLAIFGVNP